MPNMPGSSEPKGGLPYAVEENLIEAKLANMMIWAYHRLDSYEASSPTPFTTERRLVKEAFDYVKYDVLPTIDLKQLTGKDALEIHEFVNQTIGKRLAEIATSPQQLERFVDIYPQAFEHLSADEYKGLLEKLERA